MTATVDHYLRLLEQNGPAALLARIAPVLVQLRDDDGGAPETTPMGAGAPRVSAGVGGLPVHLLVDDEGRAPPSLTVGRSRSAQLAIPLERLSKLHVRLDRVPGGVNVTDLGSKNGSHVGRAKLVPDQPVMLADGGLLLLGPYPFRFFEPGSFVAWLERLRDDGAAPTVVDQQAVDATREVRDDEPRLEIVCPLGRGGMADVVLARRRGPGGFVKEVAVKRLLPEFATERHFVEMFQQEARIAARISHPNVVQIFDLGFDGKRYFIAMEYVVGWDLATVERAARKLNMPFPVDVVCRIGADLCAGLHAAHTGVDDQGRPLNIVHRDVSPHNVLLSTTGAAKLSDFGISRAADSLRLTRPGEIKGKVAYMAPEQLRDLPVVDARSDQFAACITLYEALSGTPLFRRGTDVETLNAILEDPVPDLRSARPDVPPRLAAALHRGLERDPAKRFPSMAALEDELVRAAVDAARPATTAAVASWLERLAAAGAKLPPVGDAAVTQLVRRGGK